MKNLILSIILLSSIYSYGHKTDSIGIRVRNGRTYILHKVEKGDGLYRLSRKYNISIKTIVDDNPGSDNVIKIDQLIWILTDLEPVVQEKVVDDYFNNLPSKEYISKPNVESNNQLTTFAKYHKVLAGETLYSISKKYNTSVEMIKNLNNMSLDNIAEGQRILVQDGQAKIVFVSDNQSDSFLNSKSSAYSDLGFDTKIETKTIENNDGYYIKVETLKEYNIEKIEEGGDVIVGDSKLSENKNFALHYSAPNGQVIMVTNPKNSKTVFVKIIGNFTKPVNSSEIIKLSSMSASAIGVSSKDKVMLSYAIAR
ncbi:MAG: LysM peptidoglycan-binding domain-containing protein [Bacteroidota bacterium]